MSRLVWLEGKHTTQNAHCALARNDPLFFFCTELALCQELYAKSLHFTTEFLGDICIQTVASMIV